MLLEFMRFDLFLETKLCVLNVAFSGQMQDRVEVAKSALDEVWSNFSVSQFSHFFNLLFFLPFPPGSASLRYCEIIEQEKSCGGKVECGVGKLQENAFFVANESGVEAERVRGSSTIGLHAAAFEIYGQLRGNVSDSAE